jgi:hypothetical protein
MLLASALGAQHAAPVLRADGSITLTASNELADLSGR